MKKIRYLILLVVLMGLVLSAAHQPVNFKRIRVGGSGDKVEHTFP
jgi:hypothetical protein